MSLGQTIRSARQERGYSLRRMAREICVTPPYASDFELGRRVPSETVLRKISDLLSIDFDLLMQLAGRVGEDAERYLKENRLAGRLIRTIADERLNDEGLAYLLTVVSQMDDGYKQKEQKEATDEQSSEN